MTKPILVVYATKRESTHEVADALASRMRRLGHEVDVRPAAEVGTLRPWGRRRALLGRWHRDARHSRTAGCEGPRLGPATRRGTCPARPGARQGAAARSGHGGVVDPAKLRFPFNRMQASDARDWEAIRSWADEIAARFELLVAA